MTRSHSSRLLAAGIAALIAFSVSAAEPKRPVNVCIENAADCGTTPDQAAQRRNQVASRALRLSRRQSCR